MEQVHLYYTGGKASASATRKIVEVGLMEEFHWTYDEIQQIPYKRMQELLLIRSQKHAALENKRNIEEFKREHGASSGNAGQGGKKTYREL